MEVVTILLILATLALVFICNIQFILIHKYQIKVSQTHREVFNYILKFQAISFQFDNFLSATFIISYLYNIESAWPTCITISCKFLNFAVKHITMCLLSLARFFSKYWTRYRIMGNQNLVLNVFTAFVVFYPCLVLYSTLAVCGIVPFCSKTLRRTWNLWQMSNMLNEEDEFTELMLEHLDCARTVQIMSSLPLFLIAVFANTPFIFNWVVKYCGFGPHCWPHPMFNNTINVFLPTPWYLRCS